LVRRAVLDDLGAITEIYNEAVLRTVATFDVVPKTVEEQRPWFMSHGSRHHILVAEEDGGVMGWASLSKWSDRCAYSDTAEISIYVEEHRGKGIGKRLMKEILDQGQKCGLHSHRPHRQV